MFTLDQLKKEIKKDNWHYELIKKSELRPLVTLLSQKMPKPTAHMVQTEMGKVSQAKWLKYKNTKAYLEKEFAIDKGAVARTGPTKKSSDGRHHYIIDQTKGSSCGPACVRMVGFHVLNKKYGEEEIRQMIERHEGGTVSKLTSETQSFKSGSHDWGNHGAKGSARGGQGTWDVGAALTAMKIKHKELPDGNAKANLKKTTYKKPGIAVVQWSTGGLHWVVAAGNVGATGKVLILDPACGLFEIDPNVAEPQYQDQHGTVGKLTGRMVLVT